MKKVLFLIHDLGGGGAEKVLINLVNNLNPEKFDISVVSLFGGGVNEKFLAPHIHYRAVWKKPIRCNSKLMKLLRPEALHKLCVKEHYDIEVAYLEGPCARIISGCADTETKTIAWIHVEQQPEYASRSFRSYKEASRCYCNFDRIVCVSVHVQRNFLSIYPGIIHTEVHYNTLDAGQILDMKDEPVEDGLFSAYEIKMVGVGKIIRKKGFDRLARIIKRLREDGYPVHFYVLGVGEDQPLIEAYLRKNELQQFYTFLGYQLNPYKYVARCDLFVCASWAEGFSTATAEALIMGIPVCTVDVSGMQEMLGNNEYGIITENDEEALYQGIKRMLCNDYLKQYKEKAIVRGKMFNKQNTVRDVEIMFEQLTSEQSF